MKVCIKCGIDKSLDEFQKRKSAKDGHRGECRLCLKSYHKEWSDNNREHVRFQARTKILESRYGLNHNDLEFMKKAQEYKCLICKDDITEKSHVDHNHDTGSVRGLLCGSCNRALGYLKDNPNIVLNAYQYLIEKGHYG